MQLWYTLCFTPMALFVPLNSSDIVVLPSKPYVTHLEYQIVLELNKLMANKCAWKKDALKTKATHPLQSNKPLYAMNPMPKCLTPSTSYSSHGLERVHLRNTH
jgi:hypothetical protein